MTKSIQQAFTLNRQTLGDSVSGFVENDSLAQRNLAWFSGGHTRNYLPLNAIGAV